MNLDDLKKIIISGLLAVSTGGFSNLMGEFIDPVLIASLEISASYGVLGAILTIVVVVRLIIQDTKEYAEMGVYGIIAALMLLLPWGTAVILMFLSWIPLSFLGVKVRM